MGSNESQNCIYYDMYSSLAIVALSAQPPGVNELCVCVYVKTGKEASSSHFLLTFPLPVI